jgi:hypothetical protein
MKRASLILAIAMLSGLGWGTARADIVHLTNGGRIEGKARRENGKVFVEQPSGVVVVPAQRVVEIERKVCDLEVFEERWKALDPKAPGAADRFVELAGWRLEHKMDHQAGACYRKTGAGGSRLVLRWPQAPAPSPLRLRPPAASGHSEQPGAACRV